jgi:hypothetical protein
MFGTEHFVVLKLRNFGKYSRNTWKVQKCSSEEGWKGAVGKIVWRRKKNGSESGTTEICFRRKVRRAADK